MPMKQDQAEVGDLLVVGFVGGSGGIRAAAGGDDGCLLAFEETFVAAFGRRGEGLADTDNVVDPGLEGGGHGEVVHGGGDQDVVGCVDLADELIGDAEGGPVLSGVLVGCGVRAADPLQIDEGEVRCGEVAGGDLGVGMVPLPIGKELFAETAGEGVVAAGADVKLEKMRH